MLIAGIATSGAAQAATHGMAHRAPRVPPAGLCHTEVLTTHVVNDRGPLPPEQKFTGTAILMPQSCWYPGGGIDNLLYVKAPQAGTYEVCWHDSAGALGRCGSLFTLKQDEVKQLAPEKLKAGTWMRVLAASNQSFPIEVWF
jgi:hypothetical protein